MILASSTSPFLDCSVQGNSDTCGTSLSRRTPSSGSGSWSGLWRQW